MKLKLYREGTHIPGYTDFLRDPELLRVLRGEVHVGDTNEIIHVPFHDEGISVKEFDDFGRAIVDIPNLTSLELRGGEFGREGDFRDRHVHYELKLLESVKGNRTLQHLCLRDIDGGEAIRRLQSFLEENDHLQSFEGTEIDPFTPEDMRMFMRSLSRRRLPLEKISLSTRISKEAIQEMVSFFKTNPKLTPRSVSLTECQMGDDCCSLLSEMIDNTNTNLEQMELLGNNMGHLGFRCIAAALTRRNRPMKLLSMGKHDDYYISNGDSYLIKFLGEFSSKPDLLPDNLIFGGNHITPNALRRLGDILSNRNSPLETLGLKYDFFCRSGLRAFFDPLHFSPQNAPRHLDFFDTNLYDGNSKFPALALSEFLRRPNCSVEIISIKSDNFQLDDELMELFVDALWTNETLTKLAITSQGVISVDQWNDLASLLGQQSSIDDTYYSNHTIFHFGRDSHHHPFVIRVFLEMNVLSDKRMVGRMKVIHAHFASNFDVGQFMDMPPCLMVEILPRVNEAFEERRNLFVRCFVMEEVNQACRGEHNSLSIHYLIVKNNLAIFDSAIRSRRKRAMLKLK